MAYTSTVPENAKCYVEWEFFCPQCAAHIVKGHTYTAGQEVYPSLQSTQEYGFAEGWKTKQGILCPNCKPKK